MATVQRKLVHKQFNSPIGLYSDQNVKETLDRELRAFSNGTVGIETNETPRVPYNLANSSVLKMVEEEEYEKIHPAARGAQEQRQSRSRERHRPITREDVLKINRRHPKRRDISWPPSDDRSRSRSSSEEVHFDERVRKPHEIFHLKETFDRGPIDSARTNNRNDSRPSEKCHDAERLNDNRRHENDANQSAKRQSRQQNLQIEWPPRSYYNETNKNNTKFAARAFYLPDNELHIGNIETMRSFWRAIFARSRSTPARHTCRRSQYESDELKRWKSHDNIASAYYGAEASPSPTRSTTAGNENSHKKDNLPLERYKSNSYNELPPLKPRREDHKDVHHTKKKLNLNYSKQVGSRMRAARRWQSEQNLRKFTTYSNDAYFPRRGEKFQQGVQMQKSTNNIKDARLMGASEHYIVSHTPAVAGTENCGDKRKNYDPGSANAKYEMAPTKNSQSARSLQSVRTNADVRNPKPHIAWRDSPNKSRDVTATNDAIKPNDENPSQIPEQNSMLYCEKTSSPPTPSSEKISDQKLCQAKGTNLSIQNVRRDENLRHEYTAPAMIRSVEVGDVSGVNYGSGRNTYEVSGESSSLEDGKNYERKVDKKEDQDFGESNVLGLKEQLPFIGSTSCTTLGDLAREAVLTAESLRFKRCVLEDAIAQDVRRISEYIKRAEQEAVIANRYANDSIAITPLQAILKQIVLQKGFLHVGDPIGEITNTMSSRKIACFDPASRVTVIQAENMPVVDQALVELFALSQALEAFESTIISSGNNFQPVGACIVDLQADDHKRAVATSINVDTPTSPARTDSDSDSGSDPNEATVDSTLGYADATASGTSVDKVIRSKNILSGYLITKQSQEVLFKNVQPTEMDTATVPGTGNQDISKQSPSRQEFSIPEANSGPGKLNDSVVGFQPASNSSSSNGDYAGKSNESAADSKILPSTIDETDYGCEKPLHIYDSIKNRLRLVQDNEVSYQSAVEKNVMSEQLPVLRNLSQEVETHNYMVKNQAETCQVSSNELDSIAQTNLGISRHEKDSSNENIASNFGVGLANNASDLCKQGSSVDPTLEYQPTVPWRRNRKVKNQNEQCDTQAKEENVETIGFINHSLSSVDCNYTFRQENSRADETQNDNCTHRSRCRTREESDISSRIRSLSQPSDHPEEHFLPPLTRQLSFDSSESRFYDSPRLYMPGLYWPAEGYKRVAWPPAESAPVYATVPQPQNPAPTTYEVKSQNQPKPAPLNYSQSQQYYQQQHQSKPQYQQNQYQQSQYRQTTQQQQTQYNQQQYQQPQYERPQYQQPQYQQPKPQYQQYQQYHQTQPQSNQQPQYQSPRYESSPGPQAQSNAPRAQSYVSQPQQQYDRQSALAPGGSTVSFAGGIARSVSPSRPIAREYLPGMNNLPSSNNMKPLTLQSSSSYASPPQPAPQSPIALGWSHVRGPTPTRIGYSMQNSPSQYQRANSAPYGSEPYYGAYQPNQNNYQPQTQVYQPVSHHPSAQDHQAHNYAQPQQYYTQAQPQTSPYARGQSPGVIHLRKETPVSQRPAPVYTSQPATAVLRGGSNMRGDLKWPPPEYKSQTEKENEERRRIAMGPACRPRRICKDYSQFFAKNALNHYYPGYKIPPGTQHMYTQY